jgi:hypothetical protein
MAIDASGVLGSRQLAGVKVNAPGTAARLARNQGGSGSGSLAADIVLSGQPPAGGAETPPPMSRYRIVCGVIWAVIALGIGAGGVAELTIANIGGAVVCSIIAVPAAWYDYRIWTRKARRLLLIL